MQLSLDRKSFIDILGEGQYDIGAVLQPPPEGFWGMPSELLEQLPGYSPDNGKNREQARVMMRSLGYGPDEPLKVKLSTRNIAWYRDTAAILIDQLKQIWIDGELAANWVPKLMRKHFTVAMSLSGSAFDDPDRQFYENYSCGSPRNYTGCNQEVSALIDRQSAETGPARRKELVWQIERRLIEDAGRTIIFFMRQDTCWQLEVKGLTLMDNSIFKAGEWRMFGSTDDVRPPPYRKGSQHFVSQAEWLPAVEGEPTRFVELSPGARASIGAARIAPTKYAAPRRSGKARAKAADRWT